jgi:DNA-binding SARP family transcriptional activator/tetratricopeptide (TPR) repeat protein
VGVSGQADRQGRRGDAAGVRVVLCGGATVRSGDGAPLPLAPLDAALLAFVAIEGSASRERLLGLLWPDQAPESARNALRQRLFRLRRRLEADVVAQGAELLSLAPGVAHDLDDAGAEGDLLAGLHYPECGELEEWLETQRHARRQRRRAHDDARIDALAAEGRLPEAVALAERLVAADALDEAAARRLMQLRYLQGEHAAALAVFERLAAALTAAHGAVPSPRTRELLETIRAARAPQSLARHEIPASLLRPPRLVGRDRERVRLQAAWNARRAIWLLGEAGLGKSRLIADFVQEQGGGGADPAIVVVAARPGDAGVPYASLGRVVRALLARQPTAIDLAQRRELARVVPEIERDLVAAGAAPQRRLTLLDALVAMLVDAGRDGVAAVVVDDLHFADAASLEMLPGLVLDDALSGLRWGFAQRPAEGDAALEAFSAALHETGAVELVALGALDPQAMRELVASLGLDADWNADELASRLLQRTGGNPLFALETIKHLVATGARTLGESLPQAPTIHHLIERRLRRLTPRAIALARVAALAGVDLSIELAEQVMATRAIELVDAWHELEEAQVLRGLAFAHDQVFETTLAGIPAPIAAHAHAAIAAFLEARGEAPARVAAHWIASGEPHRALVSLHAAAEAARRAMRRKEEAGFLSRAAEIETEAAAPAAFETLRTMVDALWNADRRALDAKSYDRLDAAASTPRERGIARTLRAAWLHEQGDLEAAQAICEEAAAAADAAHDAATGTQARQRLAQILHSRGEFDAAVTLLRRLEPWIAEHAGDAAKVDFYGDFAIALDNADRGAEARGFHKLSIELGRRIGAWSDVVTVLGNLAVSWATAGHMARAIDLLHEALRLAAAHDEARGCGATLPIELHNALRDCARYADAVRWIDPALAAADGQLASWKPLVQSQVACGWIHLGQHARAQREIDAALTAGAPGWLRAKALQMRARLWLALGRGARRPLEEAHALMAHDGRRALRASIVLDHALLLEPAEALAAARGVVAASERIDMPGAALAAHVRAMRFAVDAGRADEALAHVRAAAALDEGVMPNDLYRGEHWLQAWRAWALAGRDDEARESLSRARAWLRTTLREHVPEPFRDGFIRANPVNQQLVRAFATAGLDDLAART